MNTIGSYWRFLASSTNLFTYLVLSLLFMAVGVENENFLTKSVDCVVLLVCPGAAANAIRHCLPVEK